MSRASSTQVRSSSREIPAELRRLRDRIAALPEPIRDQLAPTADDAVEEAVFRGRVLSIAKDALERYRLELAMVRFDLDVTRRERETFRDKLEAIGRRGS